MRYGLKVLSAMLSAAVLVGATAFVVSAADDKAADQPKAAKAEKAGKKGKAPRLVKPWSDMSSLSDEQKSQIGAIHKKALDEIKQVKQRETDDILKLLNDEQKKEYDALVAKDTADRKMKKGGDAGSAEKGE